MRRDRPKANTLSVALVCVALTLVGLATTVQPRFSLAAEHVAEPSDGQSSPERIRGRYVVDVAEGADVEQVSREIAATYGGTVEHVFDHVIGGFGFKGPDDAGEKMVLDPRVRSVYTDYLVRVADVRPELEAIRAPQAWVSGFGGGGARIAFVDTGVNPNNPYLSGRVLGMDGSCVEDDGADQNGHGTRMFGIAYGNSDLGVLQHGAGYGIKVFPGSSSSTTTSALICGLNRAMTLDVQVVNLSLTGVINEAQQVAVEALHDSGKAVVAAAGNSGGSVSSPARIPKAVAVSALDNSNTDLAAFSNRGASIDVGAPGVDITQLSLSGCCTTASGTSAATPHVSAVMAEVMSTTGFPPALALSVLKQQGLCPTAPPGTRGAQETLPNTNGGPCESPQRVGDTDGIPEPALNFAGTVNSIGTWISMITPVHGRIVSGYRNFKVMATSIGADPEELVVDYKLGSDVFRRATHRPDQSCPVPRSCHLLGYDTSTFPRGPTTFTARLTRPDGKTRSISIGVIVDNVASPVIVSPADGETLSGRRLFKVMASDVRIPSSQLVVEVQVGNDAFRRAAHSPNEPCPTLNQCYVLIIDLSGFPSGATPVTARVTRADGSIATDSVQTRVMSP